VLFAELCGPVGMGLRVGPEDLRQVVGEALTRLIAEMEGLGGTVTSVSGAGLAAIFGAPEAHEDDPERAVRAGSRAVSAIDAMGTEWLSVRMGIETGPAVVGPLVAGGGYGAVGEVVGLAAALQSAAKAGSVLVGPITRAAAEGAFEWGHTEDVAPTPGAKPVVACYLGRPTARPSGYRGQSRWAGNAAVVGRASLAVEDQARADRQCRGRPRVPAPAQLGPAGQRGLHNVGFGRRDQYRPRGGEHIWPRLTRP
jgi:adenylate cyclase